MTLRSVWPLFVFSVQVWEYGFLFCGYFLERHNANRGLGAAPLGGVSLLQVYAWLAPVFSVLDGGKVATNGLTSPFFHRQFQQYETRV